MSDFVGSYYQKKATDKQMELTENAQNQMMSYLREGLGYQKELMQWQKDVYERERTERKPYQDASKRALGDLEAMTKGDFDITTTKSYQTKEKALETSLNRSLSAKGLSLSGRGIEEESRLKTGLMLGEESKRYGELSGVVNVGTMGMVQNPMLANAGTIQQGTESMSQVPAWYASQMGGIYQNQANYMRQQEQQTSSLVGSILGMYLGK